uniref:Uncharacterized protein n=1 Tax=Hyaloperonospora arabidopsidis (strain Emoy2) TaxID=559515 RepID=M4BM29_HYAAE
MRQNNDSQKLIVAGIPKSLDNAQLAELFSTFGIVLDASVVQDVATNTSRGFGFVTFSGASALRAAIKGMHRKVVEGRTLNVRQLVPKEEFQPMTPNVSKRPCWLLRKGKCTMGANCLFSHDVQDGDCGSCFEFVQTGACKRGDKCKFSHVEGPEKEGLEQCKENEGTSAAGASVGTTTRVCYSYQNGRCHRGKKCLFVHEKLVKEDVGKAGTKRKERMERRQQESDDEVSMVKKEEEKKQQIEDGNRIQLKEKVVAATGKKEEPGIAVQGNQSRLMRGSNARERKQERVKEVARPKAFEWKAKVARARTKEDATPGQDEEMQAVAPERRVKKVKREKIDMGAAFDGVSDDENDRRKKANVDKETMRANRDKLKQGRRSKRKAKKNALSMLQTTGEVVLRA